LTYVVELWGIGRSWLGQACGMLDVVQRQRQQTGNMILDGQDKKGSRYGDARLHLHKLVLVRLFFVQPHLSLSRSKAKLYQGSLAQLAPSASASNRLRMLLDPIGGFVYATIYVDGVICPITTPRLPLCVEKVWSAERGREAEPQLGPERLSDLRNEGLTGAIRHTSGEESLDDETIKLLPHLVKARLRVLKLLSPPSCHHSSTHHFIIYNLYHSINFLQTNPHYTYSQWASGVSPIIIHNTR
jgi:hypothetical protein